MEDILYNKIRVLRFVNTPVPSNTYLLENGKHCIVIDPGTREQVDVRDYIQANSLTLDYIILTHEHFDHCWGVNYLLDSFPAKVVATRLCAEWVNTPRNYFNQQYYDSDEMYQIEQVEVVVEDINWKLAWGDVSIVFINTPGHSNKGMCIETGGSLFTGDTILYRTKPFLKKRYGASKEELKKSIENIYQRFSGDTKVFPGHGEPFLLKETEEFYKQYFDEWLSSK
jgi:glyoxylase-like metal-dependent hydrolase (beta-lactamase superfamily II)